jgi:hypothetical protein
MSPEPPTKEKRAKQCDFSVTDYRLMLNGLAANGIRLKKQGMLKNKRCQFFAFTLVMQKTHNSRAGVYTTLHQSTMTAFRASEVESSEDR